MDIGSHWREWEVTELLGAGSFGRVYKIRRTGLNNFVEESALKVIRIPQNASDYESAISEGMDDESVSAYFESIVSELSNEFALMSRLKGNTNIVSFEDYEVIKIPDDFGWEIYIRMELLTPLTTYIAQNAITLKDVARIGADICRALELCEREKIIHRDIKPENIFVSAHGDYKLGDFGIAKRLENVSVSLTKKGTLSYMAPEVYKGQPYTSSVDLYSLGIVLYRLLNYNRNPFMPPYPERIRYNDREEARAKRMSGVPLPPPVNAPEDFARLILKASAYDPADRFPNARSMRLALESIISGDEESLKLYLEQLPDPDRVTTDLTLADDSNKGSLQAAGKKRGLVIGGAVLAVVLAVAIGFAALSGGSGSKESSGVAEGAGDVTEAAQSAAETAQASDAADDGGKETTDISYPDYNGPKVSVTNAEELKKAVLSASSGTVIELESGDYNLGGPLYILKDDIKLKGKGGSKPVLDSMIEIDASGAMIENLEIRIENSAYTTTNEETENTGILSQGRDKAYIKDTDIYMNYDTDKIKYGVMVYTPTVITGCKIDVVSSNGNSNTGVGAGDELVAQDNTINAGNGIGIDVFGDGAKAMKEEDLQVIAKNNTIKADSKIYLQSSVSF